MAKNFSTLVDAMSAERQERVRQRTEELLGALPLKGLRKARSLSQEELAEILDLNQATVSKLERRTDMYISTVRRFVRAMGGELEIRARFPEGVVEIDQFGLLADVPPAALATRPRKGKSTAMARKKVTGKKAATAASKTLKSRTTGKKSKSAAGSALSQRKAPKKTTGKKAATAASKTLRDGRTSKASKSAAGSALAQKPKKSARARKKGTKKK